METKLDQGLHGEQWLLIIPDFLRLFKPPNQKPPQEIDTDNGDVDAPDEQQNPLHFVSFELVFIRVASFVY
jgi:hypothetical protein